MLTTSMPSASLNKVQRWLNAKRVAGVPVQPWELKAAYEAELEANIARQQSGRSLSLQAENLAENKRMNNVNTALRQQEMEDAKKASTVGGLSQLGSTWLMYNALKKPGEGGVTTGLTNVAKKAGEAGTGLLNWGKKAITNTAANVASGTSNLVGKETAENLVGAAETPASNIMQFEPDISQGVTGGLTNLLKSTGGGLATERLLKATGIPGKIADSLPGGEKDWSRAGGTAAAALLTEGNPLVAGLVYLGTSIGLDEWLDW